jgi:hypothetical protein
VSASGVLLLRAASEIVGGNKALAGRLGIGERVLSKYMANGCELPDLLLLRAVDIILADRESRPPVASQPAQQCSREATSDR